MRENELSSPLGDCVIILLCHVSDRLANSFTQRALVILAIFLTSLSCYLILKESVRLLQILRQTGINVLTRLMGLLLAVIAVQFVIDGIKEVFLQITSGK